MVAQAYSPNNQEARQEDQEFDHPWLQSKFKAPLDYVKTCLKNTIKKAGKEQGNA